MLNNWLKQNLWNILITTAMVILTFSTLQARVKAAEEKLDRLEDVVIQIAVLQTRQSIIETDIKDIKSDVKDIKKTLETHADQ